MSKGKLGEVKSGQSGLRLAWLTPKAPCTPLPSVASHQLRMYRANLAVKEGLAQGVECEGDLAVTLPHHWLPGPIRLVWWPGVFFLPHLCLHQALSCGLRHQEWPSLIKKGSLCSRLMRCKLCFMSPQEVTPKCLPEHWDERCGKEPAGPLSAGHLPLLQPHPGPCWGEF